MEQYLEEHIESAIWAVFACAYFHLISMVTNFLSILSMSSKFYTGHAFHLFKLIFSMVSSSVLLSEKNIKKLKRKSQRSPKKQQQPKNREKRWAKVEQYLEEHIESAN